MENKKLLNILQKDMNELEELIAEIKIQGNFNALEMEFVHTRAKGVLQLIQLLNKTQSNGNIEDTIKNERIEQLKETVSEIREEVTDNSEDDNGKIEIEELEKKKVEKEFHNETDIEKQNVVEKESYEKPEDKVKPGKNEVSEQYESSDEEDDDMLDEEEIKQSGSTLGDSFLKGKSINDILTDQNKLEFKLSNRPVESIKTAIGINDRFQYIRELFDGNSEQFSDAVQILDSKQNIKEAVDYLKKNFKWKKSETSLKFVNLVKRRFQNE